MLESHSNLRISSCLDKKLLCHVSSFFPEIQFGKKASNKAHSKKTQKPTKRVEEKPLCTLQVLLQVGIKS